MAPKACEAPCGDEYGNPISEETDPAELQLSPQERFENEAQSQSSSGEEKSSTSTNGSAQKNQNSSDRRQQANTKELYGGMNSDGSFFCDGQFIVCK
jgi:hypothetical protein